MSFYKIYIVHRGDYTASSRQNSFKYNKEK